MLCSLCVSLYVWCSIMFLTTFIKHPLSFNRIPFEFVVEVKQNINDKLLFSFNRTVGFWKSERLPKSPRWNLILVITHKPFKTDLWWTLRLVNYGMCLHRSVISIFIDIFHRGQCLSEYFSSSASFYSRKGAIIAIRVFEHRRQESSC